MRIKYFLGGVLTALVLLSGSVAFAYVVQPGDSVSKIAKANDTTVQDIVDLNGLENPNLIHVGDELFLQALGARTQDSGWQKKDVSGTLTDVLDDAIEEVDLQGASLTNLGSFGTVTTTGNLNLTGGNIKIVSSTYGVFGLDADSATAVGLNIGAWERMLTAGSKVIKFSHDNQAGDDLGTEVGYVDNVGKIIGIGGAISMQPGGTAVIPLETCTPQSAGPSAITPYANPTTSSTVTYRDFASSTPETAVCTWAAPPAFDTASVQARMVSIVSNATGPSSTGFVYNISGCANLPAATWGACTPGALATSTVAVATASQYDLLVGSQSDAMTITGLANGTLNDIYIVRNTAATADDYAQDVGGVWLLLTWNNL